MIESIVWQYGFGVQIVRVAAGKSPYILVVVGQIGGHHADQRVFLLKLRDHVRTVKASAATRIVRIELLVGRGGRVLIRVDRIQYCAVQIACAHKQHVAAVARVQVEIVCRPMLIIIDQSICLKVARNNLEKKICHKIKIIDMR